MQSELKPCPFCGSDRLMVLPPTCDRDAPYSAADRAYPVVRCSGCYTDVPGRDFDASSKSAVEAWNCRAALSDKQAGEVKALEWKLTHEGIEHASFMGVVYYARRDGRWGHTLEVRQNQSGSSMEEAKAAAQADYEQRIRRTLVAVPAGVRWRVFEDTTHGWWGIEIDGDEDGEPILYPIKTDRASLDKIADAYNATASTSKLIEERDTARRQAEDQWAGWVKSDCRVRALEAAVRLAIKGIEGADPEVLTDILWMPEAILKGATVVDVLQGALVDVPAVEPVGYTTQWNLDEVRAGKLGTIAPADTMRPENEIPLYTSPPLSREGEDSAEVIEELLRHLDRMQSNAIRAGELAWHPNSPIAESIEKVRVLAADVSSGGDHG